MKKVERFETVDGREFSSETAAESHERLVFRCQGAMARLGEHRPVSGHFVQHSVEDCERTKSDLLSIIRQNPGADSYPVLQKPDREIGMFGILGRILDDGGGPMWESWARLMCIDFATGKEYEQPYFAKNPDKFEPAN